MKKVVKYKSVDTPSIHECGYAWWVPDDAPQVIQWVEEQNPGYVFVQFVTRPGNGGYQDFVILKEL